MEKREQIILALTAAVVLYGAYDFLLAGHGSRSGGGAESGLPSSELVTTISTQMASTDNELNRQASAVLTQLKAPFDRDPFYPGDFQKDLIAANTSQATKEKEAVVKEPEIDFQPKEFLYSGYLQMGGEAIAIVNGTDHKLGDTINDFRLEKIEPEQIQLRKANRTFEAFLQESKW